MVHIKNLKKKKKAFHKTYICHVWLCVCVHLHVCTKVLLYYSFDQCK